MSDIYTVKEKDRNESDGRADTVSYTDNRLGLDIKTGLRLIAIYFLILLLLSALVVVGVRGMHAWSASTIQNSEDYDK